MNVFTNSFERSKKIIDVKQVSFLSKWNERRIYVKRCLFRWRMFTYLLQSLALLCAMHQDKKCDKKFKHQQIKVKKLKTSESFWYDHNIVWYFKALYLYNFVLFEHTSILREALNESNNFFVVYFKIIVDLKKHIYR